MKNESELSELWPDVRDRGAAALRPGLASRVLARAAAARDDLRPGLALALGLGTAIACLALTVLFTAVKVQRSSDTAISQWEAFGTDDGEPEV